MRRRAGKIPAQKMAEKEKGAEVEFAKLNRLLAGSNVSVDLVRRLAAAFPQLEAAVNALLARDINLFIREGRLDLLRLAKERGEAHLKNAGLLPLVLAVEFGRADAARWLLTQSDMTADPAAIIADASVTPQAVRLVLQNVAMPRDTQLVLATNTFAKLAPLLRELDQMRASRNLAELPPAAQALDPKRYPLIRKYAEVTWRTPQPAPAAGAGKIKYTPNHLDEIEAELKAAMWILRTADETYPEDNFIGSLPNSDDAKMYAALIAEYKRAYVGQK